MCGPHHCLGRDAFASGPGILRRLLHCIRSHRSLNKDAPGHSPGSANRCDQFTRHPWRTSPPLRPRLSCRYTQPIIAGLRDAFKRRPLTPAARAEITTWDRAEGRGGAKRRCYQRRSGAPTRGTGPLRLALAGATRSGSAGVGSPGSRSAGEATPHPSGVNWNDN
jgi:hypothetical protein